MTEDELMTFVARTLEAPAPGECQLCREPTPAGRDFCEKCLPEGMCAWLCGEPAMPGGELCVDCAKHEAAAKAKHEAQERRAAAKAEREAHLAALAAEGCGCGPETGCRRDAFDWKALPKSKANKAWEELWARCAKVQRWRAELAERRRRCEAEREARLEARAAESKARWAAVTIPIRPSPLLAGLRDMVLAQRHDRCPKWRFRLAPDLVVQIQPKPAERRDQFQRRDRRRGRDQGDVQHRARPAWSILRRLRHQGRPGRRRLAH
jgi:hypothetical protein